MWKTLSIVAAILTAGAAYFSYQTVEQFRNERKLLEIAKANRSKATNHLEDTRKALAVDTDGRKKTEADRDALVKKIDELNVKIADLTKQVTDKKAELESATARWTEVKKSVDDLGGIDTLKNQLASLSQEKATLEGSIESLKQKTAMATERFNSLTKTIAAMKTKESWQAQGIMEDNFRARVIQSDPTFGFVMLNAGNTSGMVTGATLDVKRGGNVIAQLKVTNVDQRYAVADIVEGTLAAGTQVQPGDTVTVSRVSTASGWRENQRRAAASPTPAAPKTPATKPATKPGAPPADAPDPFAVDPAAPPAAPPATPPAAPPGTPPPTAPPPAEKPTTPGADPFAPN
jgi:hypothetical protein